MAIPTFSTRCLSKTLIARDVYELVFEKPEGFGFQAGQFILFDVPHPDNKEDIQARAYSIASTPDDEQILLVIRLLEGGRMSRWITEKCREGSSLLMKGPFGNFLLDADASKDLLFLCTSTGLAPIWSHIRTALAAGDTRRMVLIYGARSEEDLFYADHIQQLASTYPNFQVHIALTQPSDAWAGLRGRVRHWCLRQI
jgi:ferredoxin-NADP reductase